MSALAERVAAEARALAQRATAEKYQSPFWQERVGAKGRELGDDDGPEHLGYLVRALAASDPGVMTAYARELQADLVRAGLCTLHIAEHLSRLEHALAELVADSEPARRVLQAARAALVYDTGPARELQQCSDALAERVLDALWSRQTGWFAPASSYVSLASLESITHAERARWKSDLLEHLSYLADALHTGRAEAFIEHAIWVRAFFARRHAPVARMEETLRSLADCLPSTDPPVLGARSPAQRPAGTSASSPPGPGRTPLSEPPPPPVPLPLSIELARGARGLIGSALERLRLEAERERSSQRPSAGFSDD
jgi:hypothetical protein